MSYEFEVCERRNRATMRLSCKLQTVISSSKMRIMSVCHLCCRMSFAVSELMRDFEGGNHVTGVNVGDSDAILGKEENGRMVAQDITFANTAIVCLPTDSSRRRWLVRFDSF